MITKTDLEISNVSYTNKDFAAIYTELLELATKISGKFKPAESNEGDPFIVLLKLMAFVGDKINYNIDKNVLERFMSSATQEKSVQELTTMLGYNMSYYRAATTNVVCKYNFTGAEQYSGSTNSSATNGIYIPKYTKFMDSSGNIMFVSTEAGYINPSSKSSNAIPVIQGDVKSLTTLSSDVISLENLDGENRVFFPESMVAENGVFIDGGSSDDDSSDSDWERVSNLNSAEYGSYSYEFGYDSDEKLPYVKFPEWITKIIGSGLTISYVVTEGASGNVSSKAITSITLGDDYLPTYADEDVTVTSGNITVVNSEAANNGEDPETINEAYEGFKKTIGTFDTLVTCRDYANAIYNALDDYSNDLVSNVQVADRRTDLNYGCDVATFTTAGPQMRSIISVDESGSPVISAYDLCLYPLTSSNDMEMSVDSGKYEGYDRTFDALYDASSIKEYIEGSKCLSHDYKKYKVGDIYSIRNHYRVEAVLSTTYKVTSTEQYDILLNANNALAKAFNARKVDFGHEIPTSRIREVIEESDSRIKDVDLYEPEVTPMGYVITAATSDGHYTLEERALSNANGDSDWFKRVVARNVLAGRIELFNYNDAFDFGYGESGGSVTAGINRFTSSPNITSVSADGYKLLSNEVVELISPAYVADGTTYPYGVNYHLKLNGDTSQAINLSSVTFSGGSATLTYSDGETQVKAATSLSVGKRTITTESDADAVSLFITSANSYKYVIANGDYGSEILQFPAPTANVKIGKNQAYTLKSGDKLVMQWTNSSEQSEEKVFQTGDIVKPNFDMYTTEYRRQVKGETALQKTLSDGTTQFFFTLGTSDELTEVKRDSQSITSKKCCYWSVSDADNSISFDDVGEYILGEGEYFFYADPNFTELFTFGPGTLIKVTGLGTDKAGWTADKVSDISVITEGDLDSYRSLFKTVECNSATGSSAKSIEFVVQDIITLSSGDKIRGVDSLENNTFASIDSGASYKLGEDDWTSLPSKPEGWKARALLDLVSGPETPQTLVGNQTISFYDDTSDTPEEPILEIASGKTFRLNELKQVTGGVQKELTYVNLSLKQQSMTAYAYDYSIPDGVSMLSVYGYNYSSVVIPDSKSVSISVPSVGGFDAYIMVCVSLSEGKTVQLSVAEGTSKSAGCINHELDDNTMDSTGVYVFRLASGVSKITLKFSSSDIGCILSKPRLVSSEASINPLLGLSEGTDLIKYIQDSFPEQWKEFNAAHFVDSVRHIEVSESFDLSDPSAFYDYNNVANKWTIPVLDLDDSSIRIARGSRK